MKRLLAIIISVLMLLGLAACAENNIEGTLEDLMHTVYVNSGAQEEFYEGLNYTEVEEERNVWFFGTADISYKEAYASEPFINISTYSFVILRINDEDNVEDVKLNVKQHANPQKWVCVGVDPDDVYVESNGDLVMLLMCRDEEMSAKIIEAFLALGK